MTGNAVIAGQLREQLLALYRDLAAGNDVPPARRFRLEGALALAGEAGLLRRDDVLAWLRLAGVDPGDVDQVGVGMTLPVWMATAPVYPGSSGPE